MFQIIIFCRYFLNNRNLQIVSIVVQISVCKKAKLFKTLIFQKIAMETHREPHNHSDLTQKLDPALLDQPITVLRMNPVTRIALMRLGIDYLGQLVQQEKKELEEKRRLGPRSVDLLRDELLKKGLDYGMKINYVSPENREA